MKYKFLKLRGVLKSDITAQEFKDILRIEELPYRLTTSGYIIKEGKILLIQGKSYKDNEWKVPGGGIEGNESPEEAILRELNEELGTDKFEIIGKSTIENIYDWNIKDIEKNILESNTKGYRGQKAIQFLIKFTGKYDQIKPKEDEINNIIWVDINELEKYLLFPNQFEIYSKTLDSFKDIINLPEVTL